MTKCTVGFLCNGVTNADLKYADIDPSISDLLTILIVDGIKSSTHFEKNERLELGLNRRIVWTLLK